MPIGQEYCDDRYGSPCGCHGFVDRQRIAAIVQLTALQREAAHVNELNGVVAFCVGVFVEIARCRTLEEVKTCAEMGMATLNEHRVGMWRPGQHDDPADWRRR